MTTHTQFPTPLSQPVPMAIPMPAHDLTCDEVFPGPGYATELVAENMDGDFEGSARAFFTSTTELGDYPRESETWECLTLVGLEITEGDTTIIHSPDWVMRALGRDAVIAFEASANAHHNGW